MSASPVFVALPRLHRELIDRPLPDGVLTLWPGLPEAFPGTTGDRSSAADGLFRPEYPWGPAESAACVADFERAARDGVSGSSVGAVSAEALRTEASDLSPAELAALEEWRRTVSGISSPGPEISAGSGARVAAQRVLLLAWLRERQFLEIRDLEARVSRGQARLAGWLGEGPDDVLPEEGRADGGPWLPSWSVVLEAASFFLPAGAVVVATDDDMASALMDRGEPAEDAPASAGWTMVRLSSGPVPGGRGAASDAVRLFLCPAGIGKESA